MENERAWWPTVTCLAIVVEGETEEAFVNKVLADYLRPLDIEATPILLGGNVNVERLAARMVRMYRNCQPVTSFVDFYGFGGKDTDTVDQLEQRVSSAIQTRIGRPPDNSRIFPYVQLHEFEGLLFSKVEAFNVLPDTPNVLVDRLRTIRSNFPTPEDINDGCETAPSKRIVQLFPRYRKVVQGPAVIAAIGLDAIREQCPRFNEWLSRLESLASRPA